MTAKYRGPDVRIRDDNPALQKELEAEARREWAERRRAGGQIALDIFAACVLAAGTFRAFAADDWTLFAAAAIVVGLGFHAQVTRP